MICSSRGSSQRLQMRRRSCHWGTSDQLLCAMRPGEEPRIAPVAGLRRKLMRSTHSYASPSEPDPDTW